MMLNYCPSDIPSDGYYYCDAIYKFWMNGDLPEQSDGIVTRYVKVNLQFNDMLELTSAKRLDN